MNNRIDAIYARQSAVSYTHLDVYKRQVLYFRPRCGFGFFSKSDLSVLRNGREAILGLSRLDCPLAKTGGADVYKRQF